MHTISKATGEYVTKEHHKPIEKQYKNKEYYIDKCKEIGINAVLFAKELIKRKPYDYQKAINGICHFQYLLNFQPLIDFPLSCLAWSAGWGLFQIKR